MQPKFAKNLQSDKSRLPFQIMKNIFYGICLAMILVLTGLQAQTTPGDVTTSSPIVHVGTSNRYPIGSAENPVTAEEYCVFLNMYARYTNQDNSMIVLGFNNDGTDYFDPLLMSENSEQCCIVRSIEELQCDFPHNAPKSTLYHYSVKAGQEHVVIDALCSEQVQKKVHAWRSNPTIEELRDYIASKTEVLSVAEGQADYSSGEVFCQTLMARYPTSVVFSEADVIAQAIHDKKALAFELRIDTGWTLYYHPFNNQSYCDTFVDIRKMLSFDGNYEDIKYHRVFTLSVGCCNDPSILVTAAGNY